MANVRNMGSVATLGTKSITANGTYNASADDLDGFSQVTVNVPVPPEPILGTKTITENGTYNASADNLDGFSQVTVNVPEVVNKMIPYTSRLYGGWYLGMKNSVPTFQLDADDPHAITISFPVQSGHKYIVLNGSLHSINRCRFGFNANNLLADPVESEVSGYRTDLGLDNSSLRYGIIDSSIDGYLIGYIGLNTPDTGDIVYLVDVTGHDMSGVIS